jgi:N,N'-diacetyllegionaminate synthase
MSVFIIAEAGVNHNGSLDIAKQLVDAAKAAGVDCVKFQTFIAKNLVSKSAQKAEYQKKTTSGSENQYEMLKKLELTFDEFVELRNYCKGKEIEFLSTAFDHSSIEFLESLGMNYWKIPSGEITNLPYLIKIAKLGKQVILSTGMSTMDEVRAAYSVLKENGAKEVIVLHCTTEYPAPFAEINLNAMTAIGQSLGVGVGYSDHTEGIEVSIAATALGAKVIEKHFTLNCQMEGPDHKASIEPDMLKKMVDGIRHIEMALGNGVKEPSESEQKNIKVVRKSIVAKCSIKKGELLTEDKLTVKRPGIGISPMDWFSVVGTEAIKDFIEDEMIVI